MLLFRRFHLSLCAQWLILAGFLLYFSRQNDFRFRLSGALLLVLAAGTHPYLAVMVFGIAMAALWARSRPLRSSLMTLLLFAVCTGLGFFAFGYLGGTNPAAAGFGGYSTNLAALFDPDGWSRILPDLPSGEGQYEGFAFLGLGALLLSLVLVLRLAFRGRPERWPFAGVPLRPLVIVVGGFALFSLSSRIFLGPRELADLSGWYAPFEPLPSIFRASGRFIWPLYYLSLVVVLALLHRCLRRRTFVLLVVLASCAQLVDAWPKYSTQDVVLMALTNPHRPLAAPEWDGIGRHYREIRLLPPALVDTGCDGRAYSRFHYMAFAFVAGLEGMRINSGHLSRYPREVETICAAQLRELRDGRLERDVIYVVSRAIHESMPALASPASVCGRLDDHVVCVSRERDTPLARRLAKEGMDEKGRS